jgi:hypothetical protein
MRIRWSFSGATTPFVPQGFAPDGLPEFSEIIDHGG